MATEEIYVARFGAWIARALGGSGSFAVDLDTDGLGFQMPDVIVNDAGVKAAGAALADAGTVLQDGADLLDAAITSGVQDDLIAAFVKLFEGVYLFVDAAAELVNHIGAAAAALPAADRGAVDTFSGVMARKVIDYLVITLLEQELPRLAFLLKLLGLIDWRVVEASGSLHEPRYIRKDLKLDRIKAQIEARDREIDNPSSRMRRS